MQIKIEDREVDLTKALPLNVGDWMDLEERYQITPEVLVSRSSSISVLSRFVAFVLNKADPSIEHPVEVIRKLHPTVLMDALKAVNEAEVASVKRPT
jgi:hypothetical protein